MLRCIPDAAAVAQLLARAIVASSGGVAQVPTQQVGAIARDERPGTGAAPAAG
jgi:hypothetical protein